MRHYARGVALVEQGRFADVPGEIAALQSLSGAEDLAKAAAAGIPGPEVLTIAQEVLGGRMAMAKGDPAGAIPFFERAAQTQEALAYMEPPYWYYPVRQSLGAALLLAGRPDEARQAFEAALKRSPNSGWALFGLKEAAKARGDKAAEEDAEAKLAKVWTEIAAASISSASERPSDLNDRHGGEELPWRCARRPSPFSPLEPDANSPSHPSKRLVDRSALLIYFSLDELER